MAVKNFQSETKTLSLYNGEVELQFSPSGHRYQVTDRGVKVLGTMGVTTVIGVLDKPQLIQWACNLSVDSFKESLPIGTVVDELNMQEAGKKAALAWREKRDKAADIGTLIHKVIEEYVNNRIEYQQRNATYHAELPLNPQVEQAFSKFLLWERVNVGKWVASEKVLYSRKLNVAGICDGFYINSNGNMSLFDLKTSKGIYKSMSYQVAAYKYIFQEEQKSSKSTPLLIEDMTIVRVGKDDGELEVKKVTDYEKNAKAFLACVILKRS